jgi:hypothetical protein
MSGATRAGRLLLAAGLVLWAGAARATPARSPFVPAVTPPARDPASAAVLIGGINDSWQRLSGWVPIHAAAGRRVVGFPYDQKRTDLATTAEALEGALLSLRSEGVVHLHITAYSMGGWIAKAALDRMAADGTIAEFESIELVALATAWGGFDRANLAWKLRAFPTPGLARRISRVLELPMGFEVGSATPFIQERRAPLPPNVSFFVYEGGADEVATPRTKQERANYEAVAALARRRVRVPGARHRDMSDPRVVQSGRAADGRSALF